MAQQAVQAEQMLMAEHDAAFAVKQLKTEMSLHASEAAEQVAHLSMLLGPLEICLPRLLHLCQGGCDTCAECGTLACLLCGRASASCEGEPAAGMGLPSPCAWIR